MRRSSSRYVPVTRRRRAPTDGLLRRSATACRHPHETGSLRRSGQRAKPQDQRDLDLGSGNISGAEGGEGTLGGIDDHTPDTPDRAPERP